MDKIEDLKNVELNALPVYDDRYKKNKIKRYDDKVYSNFGSLNRSEYDECESFTTVSINSLLAYENKYCLQVYLDNCTYKFIKNQMIDYLDDHLFDTD